jgi:hypothetical protein
MVSDVFRGGFGVRALPILLLVSSLVDAQEKPAALLRGQVQDTSSGVIQDARITVTNVATGAEWKAASDENGEFLFASLTPGVYKVAASKEGFRAAVTGDLPLNIGQTRDVVLTLSPGVLSEVVEVTSSMVETDVARSQQANVVNEAYVRNLPIDRRDYLSFSLLAPGVADSKALADSNNFRVRQTPDSGLSFYGSNGRGNHFSVDGGETNDGGGGVRPTVSQEAVQEFQINRSNYSTEHGAGRGGNINIVTKSGSNTLAGSAFGFFRHQSVDARHPFAMIADASGITRIKPDANRQQVGATVGGPLRRDRLFAFLAYEKLRRREFNASSLLTADSIFQPTPAQQEILGRLPAAAADRLRAVLTSPPSTIELFRINSGVFPYRTDANMGVARLDYQAGRAGQFFLRYNITDAFDTNPNLSALTGHSRSFEQDNFDNTVLGSWTYYVSTRFVLESRAQTNYNRLATRSNDPVGPAIDIAGFGSFNRERFLPSNNVVRRHEFSQSVIYARPRHILKFGGYALVRSTGIDAEPLFGGRFTFGELPGALVDPVLAAAALTGLQAFNLGLAQTYQQGFGDGRVSALHPLYAAFVHDVWRLSSRFTLSTGLRWDADLRKQPLASNKANFAPRGGLAWDVSGKQKTLVRAGYGAFFAPIDFQVDYVVNAFNEINGFRQISQVLTVLDARNPLAPNGPINVFQTLRRQGVIGVPVPARTITPADLTQFGFVVSHTGPTPPLSALNSNSADYRNPYAFQGSFGIEQAVGSRHVVEVAYIYVHGVHLTTSRDDNLLEPPVNPAKGIRDWGVTADNPTGARYFKRPTLLQLNIYESTASSIYHGFTLDWRSRLAAWGSIQGNYTFSKAMDEATDFNTDFQPNDQLNRRADWALSSFDQRHKIVIYAALNSGTRRGVWSNFALSPVFRYNSGRPFNLLAGTELNNDRHNTTDRPFFAGRNTGLGPSFWTADVRLARRVSIGERNSLEFMLEAFNLFNHLNYTSVNNTVGNIAGPFRLSGRHDRLASQPLGFTAAADARRLQFGVRWSFGGAR